MRSVAEEPICKRAGGGLTGLLILQRLRYTSPPSDSALSSLFVFHLEGNECISANAKHCGECIQAGAKCGWCEQEVRELKWSAVFTAAEVKTAVKPNIMFYVRLILFVIFETSIDSSIPKEKGGIFSNLLYQ